MATINYLEDFLLNSGPKQDSLVHICKYINVYDMVNLNESSKHSELFVEFFKDRVIDLNSFNFTTLPSKPDEAELFQKAMEHFGSDVQKVKVCLSRISFQKFMQNVIQYCVPGNLTELEIETGYECRGLFDNFKKIPNYGWLEQVRPILHGLEKLSLLNVAGQMIPIFKLYQRDLPNLKSLTLKNFNFGENNSNIQRYFPYPTWTTVLPNELSNVTELYLHEVGFKEGVNEFELFLNQFTNLQVFVHLRENENNLQPEVIADCLYRRFPQLRGIGCNIEQSTGIVNRFSFLQKFTNMREIHFACWNGRVPLNTHEIIQYVPNMMVLSLVDVRFVQPPVAIRRIRQSIKEIIDRRHDRFPRNNRIKVIVSEEQHRDFMVLKNINEIIDLSIAVKTAVIPMEFYTRNVF